MSTLAAVKAALISWWRGLSHVARRLQVTIAAVAVVFLGQFIYTEFHNHSAAHGRYVSCIREKAAQAHSAGVSLPGAAVAQICQNETGYTP